MAPVGAVSVGKFYQAKGMAGWWLDGIFGLPSASLGKPLGSGLQRLSLHRLRVRGTASRQAEKEQGSQED